MGSDGYFIGCPKFIIRISIHAPRMGSDRHAHARMGARRSISIHAPRMGSDLSDDYDPTHGRFEFQSTLPGWGATIHLDSAITVDNVFQSTLPGWGATATEMTTAYTCVISIHAPRMGSDKFLHVHLYPWQFQSTLPGWGATLEDLGYPISDEISIHAPRMGSDVTSPPR